jgi:hypothetical protein
MFVGFGFRQCPRLIGAAGVILENGDLDWSGSPHR